jgi:Flp pilus assembly protein TadD
MMSRNARATSPAAKIARRADDLGTACARQGRFDEAAAQYRRAIALDPGFANPHNNLGNISMNRGDFAAAAACYAQCLAISPDFVLAHDNLGLALFNQGKPQEAVASHRRALALDPKSAVSCFNLGNVLLGQQDIAAMTCYRDAVALRPDYAEAHLGLGNALRLTGDLAAATASYQRAATIRPGFATAHHNLGNALLQQDRLEEGAACLHRAVALRPDYADAHISLGTALAGLGRSAEALASFRRAGMIQPGNPKARVNAAMMLLLRGEFGAGWRDYEWRRRGMTVSIHGRAIPAWQGQSFRGQTLLLHCEQGFGDSIQFVRYASAAKERGGRVVLFCPPELARLFESAAGIDCLCSDEKGLSACDFQAPLLSLPRIFDTRIDTIPCTIPYLTASPGQQAYWAQRLPASRDLKVGLVWAGNPRRDQPDSHRIDRRRSMRLGDFAPLAGLRGVQFVSLQKGDPAEQAKHPPPGLVLTDCMGEVADFADTAGLVANLDLVIGVDTSVIHLAGAMGKPVWVLSRFDGCWRWLLEREDSPWYPTLRLFRQPSAGDWRSVVADVEAALRQTLETEVKGEPSGGSAVALLA